MATDWVGSSRSAHAMPGYYIQTQHNTSEGVLLSNSACSILMSDGLWLPRRGIEPGPSGFWDIGSTARPLPLPSIGSTWIAVSWTLYYYIRSFARSFTFFIFSEKNAFFNVLYSYCSRSLHLWDERWCVFTCMIFPVRQWLLQQHSMQHNTGSNATWTCTWNVELETTFRSNIHSNYQPTNKHSRCKFIISSALKTACLLFAIALFYQSNTPPLYIIKSEKKIMHQNIIN